MTYFISIFTLVIAFSCPLYAQINWPQDRSIPVEITPDQMRSEYGSAMDVLGDTLARPLAKQPNIQFIIREITPRNLAKFQTFVKRERSLISIFTDFVAYNIVFNDFENGETLARVAKRVKDQSAFFVGVEEPAMNALDMLENKLPPLGLYMALFVDTNNMDVSGNPSIVMSVMVLPTPNEKFQFHQYIFRSVQYKIGSFLAGYEEPSGLSMDLHRSALKKLGAQYCATRPLPAMAKIMRMSGFSVITDRKEVQDLLGDKCFEYERAWGIKDSYSDFYYGS